MIRRLAWLSAKAYTKEFNKSHNDRAKMYYGYQLFYSELYHIPLILLTGWILGLLPEIIIVTLSFSILKHYTGGHHADSWLVCFIESITLMGCGAALTHMISSNINVSIIFIGIIIGILIQIFTLTSIGNRFMIKYSDILNKILY